MNRIVLENKLKALGDSFREVLYQENPSVESFLRKQGKTLQEIRSIQLFDWYQGVGLYGFYKLYKQRGDEDYLNVIKGFYDHLIVEGLPDKNVNSMANMLTLICLYEESKEETYGSVCREWAAWLYSEMPRTEEGGIQHITLSSMNVGQLWDDTLFMSVLFLVKAGTVFGNNAYIEEAIYQFYIHVKYLQDSHTGLWYHGWTFDGRHNFVDALWARGNSWITIFIPEFFEMLESVHVPSSTEKFIKYVLVNQLTSLKVYQDDSGLWHTLLTDRDTYLESSAAAGFTYGILKSVRMGLVGSEYMELGIRGLEGVCDCIGEDGRLNHMSAGTAMGKESLDYYRQVKLRNEPYGQAMAMLALIEGMYTI